MNDKQTSAAIYDDTVVRQFSDYVYVMQFTGDKITHMTKIWHSLNSLKELGWAA